MFIRVAALQLPVCIKVRPRIGHHLHKPDRPTSPSRRSQGQGATMAKTHTTTAAVVQDINDVWRAFKRTKPEELRNLLMMEYLPMVKYNAERIYAKLPDEVELDDLMQAGIFGLKDAIEGFDLERGVKFETFCAPRIRGAILDELRSMDWVPRLVRSRSHKLDSTTKTLEMELGRAPSEDEISEKLGLPRAEYDKVMKDATTVTQVSLSRKWFETDGSKDVREIDVLEDRRTSDPTDEIQRRDLKSLITKGLTRAERLILILYYYEEMTMKEIGATLDLSESRVSQMHSSIIMRLKAQLANKDKEFVVEAE
jgi:RNA polymerase sigma factor for flagellar operon FliA